jgi:hypothetical protein
VIIATHFLDWSVTQVTAPWPLGSGAQALNAPVLIVVDYSKYAYLQIV